MPNTYCFRCRGKKEMIDYKEVITANNRKCLKGICVECEGKVSLMGGYAEPPSAAASSGTSQIASK